MKVEPAAVTDFLREERQVKASTADGWAAIAARTAAIRLFILRRVTRINAASRLIIYAVRLQRLSI